MKHKLAIFDLDGTLFDTVPANYGAYNAVLNNHGFSIDEEYFSQHCNGRYYKDFLPEIIGDDPELLETVHKEKIASYPRYFSKIRENKGLFDLLDTLSGEYHIALVSTAARKSVYEILELFGKTEAFELILTQGEVPRKKPAPDGFLMAMEHFSCTGKDTIIFEDSPEGIAAAKAAGAQCFIVREIV
ncbi:MAG: HAD-IA family hydrolase [Oscillospiraceae bacterium]|nr:HAD-IA family hydrolase [Oscillospiraceae bacterium]